MSFVKILGVVNHIFVEQPSIIEKLWSFSYVDFTGEVKFFLMEESKTEE